MSTEVFSGISFDLPRANKLRAARYIGKKCGQAWYAINPHSLPKGYPDETQDWSHQAKHAWRTAMAEAWHAERQKTWPVLTSEQEKKPVAATKEASRLKQLARKGISEIPKSEKVKGAKVAPADVHSEHGTRGDYIKTSAMLDPETWKLLHAEIAERKLGHSKHANASAIIREALRSYLGGKG